MILKRFYIIEIVSNFKVNIYINKYYFTKYYKKKKFEIFLKINFLYMKIILLYKYNFINNLYSITYYIILLRKFSAPPIGEFSLLLSLVSKY